MTPEKPNKKKIPPPSNSLITLNQLKSHPQANESFHLSRSQSLPAPRLSIPINEPIYYIIFTHNYLVGAAPAKIIVYSFLDKQEYNIKVCTDQFVLVDFPPYVFGCLITQYMYLYSEQALKDVTKIIKIKISKLNVMAICSYNKGYFMGGYNRSPLPGGNLINKRTIYFVQNLTEEEKVKPLWQISIPKNNNPITILQMQNPYLMCYCEPHTYIINPQIRQVLVSFQKEFSCLCLLQGRYSLNCLNMIGISLKQRTLISVDIEKYPIYGVELNELKQKASSVCQSRQGIIYASYKNTIFSYNIFKKQKKIVKSYEDYQQVIQLICSPKNVLVVLLISRQPKQDENGIMNYGSIIDIQKQKLVDMPKSMDYVMIDSDKDRSSETKPQRTTSMNINRQIQQKRIIEVFSITL